MLICHQNDLLMRLLKIKLGTMLLLFLGITGLQAQNVLYVKTTGGTETSFSLNGIRKLTFPLRNMSVTHTDGKTELIPFKEIHYVNFTQGLSGNSSLAMQDNNSLALFPNPVIDELTVMFQSTKVETVSIQIIDMHGKIVYRETGHTVNGSNQYYLKISNLPIGLYVCCINNGRRITTGRFVKN